MEAIGKRKAKQIAWKLGELRAIDRPTECEIDDVIKSICEIVGPEFRKEVNWSTQMEIPGMPEI